jgi:hypothetical protein
MCTAYAYDTFDLPALFACQYHRICTRFELDLDTEDPRITSFPITYIFGY